MYQYRPVPEDLPLKVVRDELARVRRELDRKEGMAAGLERAMEIIHASDVTDARAAAAPAGRE